MYLTKEEEKMLDGEYGVATKKAMEILTALGDFYNAEKLIKIASAHVVGGYEFIGNEGLSWLNHLTKEGGHFRAFTTLNAIFGTDLERWREMGIPEDFAENECRTCQAWKALGPIMTVSCIAYLVGNLLRRGDHFSWSSSGSQAFCNSVLGAFGNREGGPSSLAAGIIGKTPLYGLHLPENRHGEILVDVNLSTKDLYVPTNLAALGYYVGEVVGKKIPVLRGLPPDLSVDQLRMLVSNGSVAGAVALMHVVGVTPESPTLEAALGGDKPEERIMVGKKEIQEVYDKLSSAQEKVDLVVFGCPHCSLGELREIASLLSGHNISKGVRLWAFTSRPIRNIAELTGYVDIIEKSGGKVLTDACVAIQVPFHLLSLDTLVTNSPKVAYYAPKMALQKGTKLDTIFGDTRSCIRAAISGRWVD